MTPSQPERAPVTCPTCEGSGATEETCQVRRAMEESGGASGRSGSPDGRRTGDRRRRSGDDPGRAPESRRGAPPDRPPEAASAGGPRLRAGVCAHLPETREAVEERLRALGGLEVVEPSRQRPRVVVYAAHSPWEVIALLGAGFTPHPRSVLLDLEGLVEPRAAALLGFAG